MNISLHVTISCFSLIYIYLPQVMHKITSLCHLLTISQSYTREKWEVYFFGEMHIICGHTDSSTAHWLTFASLMPTHRSIHGRLGPVELYHSKKALESLEPESVRVLCVCVRCGTDLWPLIIRQPVSTGSKGGQHHMACQPVFVYTIPYVLILTHGNTTAMARGNMPTMRECVFFYNIAKQVCKAMKTLQDCSTLDTDTQLSQGHFGLGRQGKGKIKSAVSAQPPPYFFFFIPRSPDTDSC